MNRNIAQKSIEGNIRWSLLGYSILIVVLLWGFQVAFLSSYYQTMQKASIIKAGKQIVRSADEADFESKLEEICFSHRMCSMVLNDRGEVLYSVDMMGRGCLIHSPARFSLMQSIAPVIAGQQEELVQKIKDVKFRSEGLIFARSVTLANGESRIVVVNAALEPVKSTAGILKSQLGIISVVLVAIALLLSRIVARNISRPLKAISNKARRLAKGEYTPDYDGGGILEIEELAETLNFAAEGLSKVEDLRRELVANVSHDLKTPLTMIRAYAEMIRDLTGDNPHKREEQLDVIISEADRLTALVSVLIRISQDEQEAKVYQPDPIQLCSMIEGIVERFAQTNPEYQIILDAEDAPSVVLADRDSIGRVLYNLIANAINYTGDDHKVSIALRRCSFGLRIEIRDTGRGIPEEQLPLIWERYYRSKNTHQRPVAGSGLGLSIVRGVLSAQKLPFGVESVVGEGSCFWFELPVATEQPKELPGGQEEAP